MGDYASRAGHVPEFCLLIHIQYHTKDEDKDQRAF